MKLARTLSIVGLFAGASAALVFQGCSSDDSDGGGDPPPGSNLQHPPAKPSGPATTSTEERNFALNKLYLGGTTRAGVKDGDAWKAFGYDLDNKSTTRSSTDVCKPVGTKAFQEDGPNGIDNSFGANVVTLLGYVAPSAQDDINASIAAGSFTVMFNVKGLTDDPKQTATGTSALLLGGSTFSASGAPSFSTTDNWPVLFDSVTDPNDAKSAKVKFPEGYVSGGTWVNGGAGDVSLALALQPGTVRLTIRKAIITFDHTAPGEATNGTIAGIINTNELLAALDPIVVGLNACDAFAGAVDQIRAASDMLADGTNTPDKTCDAISIGVGFTAKQIAQPQKVAEKVVVGRVPSCSDPRPDAGPADASSDGSSDAKTD